VIDGGEGGIRTPDTVARMPHFECGAIDHSATSPWPGGRGNARSVGRVCIQGGEARQGWGGAPVHGAREGPGVMGPR
jgi:hypothetical protein